MRDTDMTQTHEQARKLGVFTSSPPAPCPSSDQPPRQPTLPPIYLPSPSPGPLTPRRLQDHPKWPPCFQRSSSSTSSILCNAAGTIFLRANVTSLPCLQPSVAQWPQIQASEYVSRLPFQHCCIPPTSNLRVQAHESLGFHHKPRYFYHPRPCLGNSLYLEVPSFPFALFRSNSYSLFRIQLRDCTLWQVCPDSPCSWGQAPLQKPLVIAYGPI